MIHPASPITNETRNFTDRESLKANKKPKINKTDIPIPKNKYDWGEFIRALSELKKRKKIPIMNIAITSRSLSVKIIEILR
jgi:hypothetical protein